MPNDLYEKIQDKGNQESWKEWMFDSDIQAIVKIEQEGGLVKNIKNLTMGVDANEAQKLANLHKKAREANSFFLKSNPTKGMIAQAQIHPNRKIVDKRLRKIEFSSDLSPIIDRGKQFLVHSLDPYETQQSKLDSMGANKKNWRFGNTIKEL